MRFFIVSCIGFSNIKQVRETELCNNNRKHQLYPGEGHHPRLNSTEIYLIPRNRILEWPHIASNTSLPRLTSCSYPRIKTNSLYLIDKLKLTTKLIFWFECMFLWWKRTFNFGSIIFSLLLFSQHWEIFGEFLGN